MAAETSQRLPSSRALSRRVLAGAACGVLSALVFRQGMGLVLHAWGVMPDPPAAYGPVLGLMALWGGVWGAVLAASLARLQGALLVLAAAAVGAMLPTLVFALGAQAAQVRTPVGAVLAMNAAWGLGAGLGLALFGGGRGRARRA